MFEDIILLDNMTLQQVLAEIQDNNKIARALKNEKRRAQRKKFYLAYRKTVAI